MPDAKRRNGYERYLRSSHWARVRSDAFEFYGRECSSCGSTKRLDVHHKTYERKGKERISDLQILCHTCHSELHRQERTGEIVRLPKRGAKRRRRKAIERRRLSRGPQALARGAADPPPWEEMREKLIAQTRRLRAADVRRKSANSRISL